jgi:NAD(P)-dependent dehydrogenase (short-subunit alcohol dehydrogenase family)
MTDLTDRVAIITGASRGIGFGLAEALLHSGCRVNICSRDMHGVTTAALRLNAGPDRVLPFAVDVSNETDVQKMFDGVTRQFGPPDILVNNAGAFDGGPVDTLPLEAWNNAIGSCLTGSFLCTRAAMTMLTMPDNVNFLEAIVLPNAQLYVGRG